MCDKRNQIFLAVLKGPPIWLYIQPCSDLNLEEATLEEDEKLGVTHGPGIDQESVFEGPTEPLKVFH